jgi:gamma-glutamyltranspeptidase/glutathione hydrolase
MRSLGKNGMVASPHYLATGAGVNVLRSGGSAADAAIATNAVLAVVNPYLCGIGGDLFAQVYGAADRTLRGLNGSGRAGTHASPETVRELAGPGRRMPHRGALTVTVPGCVEAWGRLHERFGRLPLRQVLADAITYAERGFPVSAAFARAIELFAPFLHRDTPARETFLPGGKPPVEGQILAQPRLARSLRTIAEDGPAAFYTGWIGEELVRSLTATGGLLTKEDLAQHRSDWVEPLSVEYRGVTVFELPPNSQGLTALLILTMLNHFPSDVLAGEGEEYVHLLAEAARLAYADREAFITDPEHMSVDPAVLLSDAYGASRAALIRGRAAEEALAGTPGDTIYCCAADAEGNLVSLIESNFMGIGSGIMAGKTGIMLQNRGAWFSLDSDHANVIGPGKRTMHTLMPGMAFRGERPWLVFGTMGGSTQAQIHVEILTRLLDQGMALDQAIDAPRFDAVVGSGERDLPLITMETRFPDETVTALRARGHDVKLLESYSSSLGHAHAIEVLESGAYAGAADPRADSLALGY